MTTTTLVVEKTHKNEAEDVIIDSALTWAPGQYAVKHNLHISDVFQDVNDATVPVAAGLTVNSFDPDRFDFSKTYYWRVDEVNETLSPSVWEGPVWEFSTPVTLTLDNFESHTHDCCTSELDSVWHQGFDALVHWRSGQYGHLDVS